MSERYIASQHAEFVDALRACLGLQPLYTASKPTAEWWQAGMLQHLAMREGRKARKGSL